MLPALSQQEALEPTVLAYLTQLENMGFSGDVETSYASRLTVSTDNSIYQQLPQAVVFPKIRFSPRGGGTGTNGQSLTSGIVVDLSRHLNQILEINIDQQYVRVQTGVIKDQLNDALRPLGYFFSPDLSTSNRAAVFADGSILETAPQSPPHYQSPSIEEREEPVETELSFAQQGLQVTAEICAQYRSAIVAKFPPLNRFLTGYDLKHVYNDDLSQFDLTRLLCGAEGSLAFIAEAKLNITPIPKARTLVNIKYDSFDAAVSDLLTDVPNKELLGINMVEYASADEQENDQQPSRYYWLSNL